MADISEKEWRELLGLVNQLVDEQRHQGRQIDRIHEVVIGNGSRTALVSQVQTLNHGAQVAVEERKEIAEDVGTLKKSVNDIERENITRAGTLDKIEENQETIMTEQKAQGKIVRAWKYGVAAIASLLIFIGIILGLIGANLAITVP